jgi:putative aldouronate transport system permease protein
MAIRQSKADKIFDNINMTLLIGVLAVILYPLIFVVSASFSDPMLVVQGKVRLLPVSISLASYEAVFRDNSIMIGYRNTIMYTLVGTTFNLAMTIAGAYPLSRKDFK